MQPKVSVIIPTYNRAQTLERALQSVIEQSFTDFELLVVDDGSTDGTQEILKKYPAKTFTTPNKGVSAARNLAIEASKGEWVAFLDSDDEWLPGKLERQIKYAEDHPDIRLIHGEEIWVRNGTRVNPMKKHQKKGGDVFADSLKLCCISPSTVMVHRQVFQQVGVFREDFPVCEDYDLWLKITSRFPVGYIKDNLITKYGGHEDQLSRRFFAMDYWRVISIKSLLMGELKDCQRRLAEGELQKKSRVLLNGYRKHSNLVNYDQVYAFMKNKKSPPLRDGL